MLNSSTYSFAYYNSIDSKFHETYIIVDGATISEDLSGFYYVGFDFYANGDNPSNKNMIVDRDYIFNDWIIRISPAYLKNTKRIIAEDLGLLHTDFDYNDVVFDIGLSNDWIQQLNSNKLVAHITLQAAGGTYPLYICDKEVHELFGVTT